jgi:hypothetical protein
MAQFWTREGKLRHSEPNSGSRNLNWSKTNEL